ncbi:CDP-alcohol phosphatidyltransferase family protein [bacterium AH-315-B06]|nr:CDP-alcohol phosphatidyltransferase family protein [bacterium AH-315-B06]
MNYQPNPAPPAPRLILDARPETVARLDPATAFLGLSLLERLVLAARRAGFGGIVVRAGAGDVARFRLLLRDRVGVRVTSGPVPAATENAGTVFAPAYLLGEPSWLAECANIKVWPGGCRDASGGIRICGAAVSAGGRPVADAEGDPVHLADPPLRLSGADDLGDAERRLMQRLRKQTDGFMSRYFARPISLQVSRRLAPRGVSPNQMTFVSMLVGLAAAPFFLWPQPELQVIGGLLFVLHSVLDGCDGELARLTYHESRLGGLFDFLSDNLVHIAIFACMAFGWSTQISAGWPLFFGAGAVLGTAGSAAAVYWLTLRKATAAGPLYTSVSAGPSRRLTRLLDELSRRDFIYLVLGLSVFGKAHWFLALAGVGAPIFLVLVAAVAGRRQVYPAISKGQPVTPATPGDFERP